MKLIKLLKSNILLYRIALNRIGLKLKKLPKNICHTRKRFIFSYLSRNVPGVQETLYFYTLELFYCNAIQ